MGDMIAWLLEQVDIDEHTAREAMRVTGSATDPNGMGRWAASEAPEGGIYADPDGRTILLGPYDYLDPELAAHLLSWQPQRVLDDCEAKRKIIEDHSCSCPDADCRDCAACSGSHHADPTPAPCRTLRLLAEPYAKLGRPGYQESWRP